MASLPFWRILWCTTWIDSLVMYIYIIQSLYFTRCTTMVGWEGELAGNTSADFVLRSWEAASAILKWYTWGLVVWLRSRILLMWIWIRILQSCLGPCLSHESCCIKFFLCPEGWMGFLTFWSLTHKASKY